MEYHDRVLKCSECSAEFVFTAGEQMFLPTRASKTNRSAARTAKQSGPRAAEEEGRTRLADALGNEDELLTMRERDDGSFRPTQGRPVFCRECFQQRRAMGAA